MFGYFDYDKLNARAEVSSPLYKEAKPFPHIVMEEFADDRKLHKVLNDFPEPSADWWSYNNHFEKKLAFDRVHDLPTSIKLILCEMNSSRFIKFLEKLTGIPKLLADPHYRGGGLHQIVPGGKLDLHADFNWNKDLDVHRRINVILYLNKDWEPSYGGNLELWDKDMARCQGEIPPLFNRMVCFNTTSWSYHGHPHPLTCPVDRTRKSLALYYYTAERPEEELTGPHSTLYQKRPGEETSIEIEDQRQRRANGERITSG